MKLVWIALLACPLTLSARSLHAQESLPPAPVESVELGELFASAAASGNPSLSFLRGLEHLQVGDVSRDELWLVLDDLSADGVELPSALTKLLEAVDAISVSGDAGSKRVRFEFREEPEPLDLGAGWGRLGRKVAFDLTRAAGGTVELGGFKGFKLSKKHDSWIKVKLKQVRFETQGSAAVAHVDAGAGGKHVIALQSAEPQIDTSPRQLLATAKPAESATRGMLEALGDVNGEGATRTRLN